MNEDNDGFDERTEFDQLLDEINAISDEFIEWDFEGVPGMSTTYTKYFIETGVDKRQQTSGSSSLLETLLKAWTDDPKNYKPQEERKPLVVKKEVSPNPLVVAYGKAISQLPVSTTPVSKEESPAKKEMRLAFRAQLQKRIDTFKAQNKGKTWEQITKEQEDK